MRFNFTAFRPVMFKVFTTNSSIPVSHVSTLIRLSRLLAVSGLLFLLNACGSGVVETGNNNNGTHSLEVEISPASGQTYTSSRMVTIEAVTDGTRVAKVRFYDSDNYRGTDYTAPYTYNWYLTHADNGTHTWKAVTYETNGDKSSDSVILSVDISPGENQWSKRLGGPDADIGYATAVDARGNRIVVGSFTASANFGSGTVHSSGFTDIFVAKYSDNGTYLWSRTFGGTGDDRARAVAVDSYGNIVMAGFFQNTVDFGGGDLTTAGTTGDYDIFLAKYSVSGEHLWSKRFGDTTDDKAYGVAVDKTNNIILTGYFRNRADFGGNVLAGSLGAPATFIAKYSTDGNHLWSRQTINTLKSAGNGIAVDTGDNVVVTGYFSGDTDFDSTDGYGNDMLVSAGATDIFLAKYSASGNYLWGKRFGDWSDDTGQAVAVDRSTNNITVAGSFLGNVDFGGGNMRSIGVTDMFVVRFTAAGDYRWAKHFGGPEKSSIGYGISVDNSGEIVTTGSFDGSVDFGDAVLKSAGGTDIFLAKFSKTGSQLWSKRLGGSGNDTGYAVTVDGVTGNTTLTGYFSNSMDFGGGTLSSAGSMDTFLAVFGP
jgi:hypothetical protein